MEVRNELKRILLYGHDTFGLGHYRRNLTLGQRIVDEIPDSSVLCLTGSSCVDSFELPPRFDCVRLPGATKDSLGRYESLKLDVSIQDLTALRAGIILETVKQFSPHLVLVDHSPIGMQGELRLALEFLRKNHPETIVVLGLRDILDDRDSVVADWTHGDVYRVLKENYDRIFVYGMKRVFDSVSEYDIPPEVEAKVKFTGYLYRNGTIRNQEEILSTLAPRTGRLVTVTVGGGGDGENVIDSFVEALSSWEGLPPFESCVVTGPLMSDHVRSSLTARIESLELPVKVIRFSPCVLDYFAASSVVISMGGYNTLCEILALKKQSIVIPRNFPRREQLIRAERFHDMGLVECIEPEELTGEGLAKVIALKLEIEGSKKRQEAVDADFDFSGLSSVVSELRFLLGYDRPPALMEIENVARPITAKNDNGA